MGTVFLSARRWHLLRTQVAAAVFAAVLVALLNDQAAAQVTEPPARIEQAEVTFDQAVEAFVAGDYGMAYRRFRLVYEAYPLNTKTTAAVLMAGKALYRDGAYADAADLLGQFVEQYPSSSYTGEARITRELALDELQRAALRDREIRLGIALPMTAGDRAYTQALFNGIRLAVDAYNASPEAQATVRMVFRNTESQADAARQAVAALAGRDSAAAIIGPLFSAEAQAAAQAAERESIVLMPPLATDEDVAAGRRYVFQANPPISVRGRVMADYAVRDLRLDRFGIFAEQGANSISERMAEGFQEEALRLGAEVMFFDLLPNARAWYQLSGRVGRDTLRSVEAVYLPIDGPNAAQQVEAALNELHRTGVPLRLLGNTRWDQVANRDRASDFYTTYTNEFYAPSTAPNVQSFQRRYRDLAGSSPDRLAYVGYDVAQYLLARLEEELETGEPLPQLIRQAPRFDGLGTRIDFEGDTVNQALFILGYRDGAVELLN